ncbi:MAG: polysaccharide deacetylase family protein [Patescibacteria group bacterium]|jgi:polysaccharide deacetylase family protein (PEP-CTERM system associated)
MSEKSHNKIALSFDLEYWYCGIYLAKYLPSDKSKLAKIYPEATEKILNLLSQYQAQATFFVLGELAEKNPVLIQKIYRQGHEIALHSLNHELVSSLKPGEFDDKTKRAKKILTDITGQSPIGYRAPNFSITEKETWALSVLAENDFKYDSSFFSFVANKWGKTKIKPYHPLKNFDLKEYPIATYKIFGFNFPLGGGIYFRLIPYPIFSFLLKRLIGRGIIPVLYFHPADLTNFIPDLKIPWLLKTVKYWGVKKSFKKFERLLNDFKTVSIKHIYENPTN